MQHFGGEYLFVARDENAIGLAFYDASQRFNSPNTAMFIKSFVSFITKKLSKLRIAGTLYVPEYPHRRPIMRQVFPSHDATLVLILDAVLALRITRNNVPTKVIIFAAYVGSLEKSTHHAMHATNPGVGGNIHASNSTDVKVRGIRKLCKIGLHWKTRNRLFEPISDQ